MEETGWLQHVQMLLGCHCAPLFCDKWTIQPGLKTLCTGKDGRERSEEEPFQTV